MNDLTSIIIRAVLIGLGATLTFDLWGQFLRHAFKITPSNICLIGRWIRHMQEGTFWHANIASTPHKSVECTVGWIAHYGIGVMFALVFITLVGGKWLQHPTPIPAVFFGAITVLAPFAIMQPLLGLGFAASKTANPTEARLRSFMNHSAFGAGLYFSARLVNLLPMALA